jgi:hypothetical protein
MSLLAMLSGAWSTLNAPNVNRSARGPWTSLPCPGGQAISALAPGDASCAITARPPGPSATAAAEPVAPCISARRLRDRFTS